MKNRHRLPKPETALVTMLLLLASASSSASTGTASQSPANADAVPRAETTNPAGADLAKEFEPRVLALVQRIARDKRISREAVEAELGERFTADPAAPGQSPQWSLQGSFNADGFLIKLIFSPDKWHLVQRMEWPRYVSHAVIIASMPGLRAKDGFPGCDLK